jgi:hypothetical protein
MGSCDRTKGEFQSSRHRGLSESASATLIRWHSSVSTVQFGFELPGDPIPAASIGETLATLCQGVKEGASFLIVRLAAVDRVSLDVAVASAHDFGADVRVCLAVDGRILGRKDSCVLDSDRVGVLLDDVDAETPLSAIICDSIEAIRFCPVFVDSASRSLRVGAALRAMLELAQGLGLATLGPAPPEDGGFLYPMPSFDYVLREVALNIADFAHSSRDVVALGARREPPPATAPTSPADS